MKRLALACLALAACSARPSEAVSETEPEPAPAPASVEALPEHVTFTEHVAPLIHEHCAVCHRPGQVAPFSLLDEAEVRDHATQIVEVTRSRFMPPWKPVRGHGEFAHDRSLSEVEIETFARWVEQGTPSGPESARRAPPNFPERWLAGEPDLVIAVPEPYDLAAEGLDVYRNFVVASPVDHRVWVRAWALDPGNPKVVHHAILSVDREGWARGEDEATPGPGFEAMDLRGGQSPGGFYLVWAPGTTPTLAGSDAAWALDPGMDLILQLHLQPSGKPESVAPRIGLYLGDRPPSRPGLTLRLGDRPIDIPAGEREYEIRDRLVLPADATFLSVFPHAHFLGRSVECRARLPEGGERWLLHIDDWDFAWQDQYRYATPLELPAGTVIDLRITWDNSAENPRNPSSPPVRVRTGPNSTDEMGNVTFEIQPHDPRGMLALREVKYRRALELDDTALGHYNLANVERDLGEFDEAEAEYREALADDPEHLWSLHNLSMLLQQRGRASEAVPLAEREVEVAPDSAAAYNNLGNALRGAGRDADALLAFRHALELDPEFELARNNLRILGE
ncbi:tetratricopeptide repeat protein [Nannocystaceae bacterium ST9]